MRELYAPMALLEGGTGMGTTPVAGGSQLFNWARTLVRGAQERDKPSAERLPRSPTGPWRWWTAWSPLRLPR